LSSLTMSTSVCVIADTEDASASSAESSTSRTGMMPTSTSLPARARPDAYEPKSTASSSGNAATHASRIRAITAGSSVEFVTREAYHSNRLTRDVRAGVAGCHARTARAAVDGPVLLDAVAEDSAVAATAGGRDRLRRALDAIERHRSAFVLHVEGVTVFVSACGALGHAVKRSNRGTKSACRTSSSEATTSA